ncbi:hypothetical protein BC943DRAFT_372672, partial [Umbelopsis sp. AD052]
REVIELNHDPLFSGHLEYPKTHSRFRWYAWWGKTKQYTVIFVTSVTSCAQCQQAKDNPTFSVLPQSTAGERPFQRVAMDLFGPLQPTDHSNRYVLVMHDTFTKFVEIYSPGSRYHRWTDLFLDMILSDNAPPPIRLVLCTVFGHQAGWFSHLFAGIPSTVQRLSGKNDGHVSYNADNLLHRS